MLRIVLAVFCLGFSLLRATSPVLTLENELLPSPAGVGSDNPALVETPTGLALRWVAASGATQGAVLDPQTRTWKEISPPATSAADSSPELVVKRAGRAAKAWFDPAPNDPSIQLSVKPASHDLFLMPVRIEDGKPCGPPSLVLLADGTVFVSWPEHYNQGETALWLRRVSPGGSLSVPVLLAVLPDPPADLRLGLAKDFDDKLAQLLLVYSVGEGETAQIVTRLLTVAPATNEPRRGPCHTCPDADEAARGHGIRGKVVSFSTDRQTLTVKHSAIEGVLSAGTTEFKVDSVALGSASAGRELFARVEKRGTDWWLFAPSWIVSAQPQR